MLACMLLPQLSPAPSMPLHAASRPGSQLLDCPLTRAAPLCPHTFFAQVWDMDIGDCVMQLRLADPAAVPGAPEWAPVPLTALAVTPDGCCCLSGDADGWLCCWSLKSGQLVERVHAHKGRCVRRAAHGWLARALWCCCCPARCRQHGPACNALMLLADAALRTALPVRPAARLAGSTPWSWMRLAAAA